MSFKIEKGVALPATVRSGGKAKYPWNDMEIGDSFFVQGAKVETFYTLTATQNKKDASKRFIARKVEDGVRVWRVETEADKAAASETAKPEGEDDEAVPAFVKSGLKGKAKKEAGE